MSTINLPASVTTTLIQVEGDSAMGAITVTVVNQGPNPIDSLFELQRATVPSFEGEATNFVTVIAGTEFGTPDGHLLIDSPGFHFPFPAGATMQITLNGPTGVLYRILAESSAGTSALVQPK